MSKGINISKERKHGRTEVIGRNSRVVSNALRGRGSRFKSTGSSRVPLVDPMEKKAKSISSSTPNKIANDNLKDDGVTVSKRQWYEFLLFYLFI